MLIGIDIRTVCTPPIRGKGGYTYYVVRELLKLDKKNQYILYTNRLSTECAEFENCHIQVVPGNGMLWHLRVTRHFFRMKPPALNEAKIKKLFFAPTSFIIPALLPKKIKSIITVHDLIAFLKISAHQTKATLIEKIFLRHALRRASHVLVPSHATKQDLLERFTFINDQNKITITPEAAGDLFFTTPKNLDEVRKKYNLPEKFILTVGGLEPRKNIARLIDAAGEALPLIIVGGMGWHGSDTGEKIAASKHVMHITDCQPADLPALYHLATLSVFPSLYEGFGLPVLEAMAAGCPVVCSNTSSLPEVAGEAALLIDPLDVRGMSEAIKKIWNDEKLQRHMSEKGRIHAAKFSWKKTAEKTLNVIAQHI